MFNTVILSGRLVATPEMKTTQNGVPVISFTVANETGYGDSKRTNFIDVVAWRKTAEFIAKYFSKGQLIGIEGAIQQRKYTDKDGNTRSKFEVVASSVQFLESKRDAERDVEPDVDVSADGFTPTDDDDLPF